MFSQFIYGKKVPDQFFHNLFVIHVGNFRKIFKTVSTSVKKISRKKNVSFVCWNLIKSFLHFKLTEKLLTKKFDSLWKLFFHIKKLFYFSHWKKLITQSWMFHFHFPNRFLNLFNSTVETNHSQIINSVRQTKICRLESHLNFRYTNCSSYQKRISIHYSPNNLC